MLKLGVISVVLTEQAGPWGQLVQSPQLIEGESKALGWGTLGLF